MDWGQTADLTANHIHQQKALKWQHRKRALQFGITAAMPDKLGVGIWSDCWPHLPTKASQGTLQGSAIVDPVNWMRAGIWSDC